MPPNDTDKAVNETWHVLQFSDALDLEFASALAEFVPTVLWKPVRRFTSRQSTFREAERVDSATGLRIRTFPLMRGYARFPLSLVAQTGRTLLARLTRQSADPQRSVLVCTTPFFAPVAELWQGPVVYWLSDFIAMYGAASYTSVRELDRRMCKVATLVCPNSERIADYLLTEAGCPPERCHVLPNATGVRSLLPAPSAERPTLPRPHHDLSRPLAGVIGNLAENMDWIFMEQLIRLTPWLYWLFVGPAEIALPDMWQRSARRWVRQHERACFIGAQPYTELYKYARAVDVAVLPYRLREPTFSGSSTRFYDHLAAGHPLLATTAVSSLRKEKPLLYLVETPEEAARVLEELRANGFEDGQREARWHASLHNTWRDRAQTMRAMLCSLPSVRPDVR